jgi:mannose-6-phosphate isomerase-like protein (cupin superfamily)
MAVEQLSPRVPIEVRNETERDPLGKLVNRGEPRGRFNVFRVDPQLPEGKPRTVELLARTDIATAIVHIMRKGGENALHAHRAQDAVWLVLQGQVAFVGEDHTEVARLNAMDGILVPRGTPYYFSCTGDETTIVLRVAAQSTEVPNEQFVYERASESGRPA